MESMETDRSSVSERGQMTHFIPFFLDCYYLMYDRLRREKKKKKEREMRNLRRIMLSGVSNI